MTIHHDKMAYGRLASAREELSEERLAQMLARLSDEADGDGGEKPEEKNGGSPADSGDG